MEWLLAGQILQRCRTAFLEEVANARSALVLGVGRGRFLSEFLSANRTAAVTCVDSSLKMLRGCKQSVIRSGADPSRVCFLLADVLNRDEAIWSRGPFNLVVTHFFLDCFRADQLATLIPAIGHLTSPKARWLLSDFRVPEEGFWRWRARIVLWLAYRFFRLSTRLPARSLVNPTPFLRNIGFELRHQKLSQRGLLHSDLWEK